MGFEIRLRWTTPSDDPTRRNRWLADDLLGSHLGLTELFIDHDHVAVGLGIPPAEILQHCPQVELNAEPGPLLGAIVTLWSDHAYVELPSVPPVSCAEALRLIRPLLQALAQGGLFVEDELSLLGEYESQRSRVEQVARIVEGDASSSVVAGQASVP
jgi:hypothetical protein